MQVLVSGVMFGIGSRWEELKVGRAETAGQIAQVRVVGRVRNYWKALA
jgi:hypothetical protein